MARNIVSPLKTWLFWGLSVLGVFLLVTWEYVVAGFSADASNITYLIVVFFIYGFFASLRVAWYLEKESKALREMDANQRINDPNVSDAAGLFDAALARIHRGERIDVRNLVSSYSIRIKARVDNIGVISGMLITIGLLGTVVGLIITVTGLGQVLSSSGTDYVAMKEGLNKTVSGMGTAFYTTFFGALLGGVVLKVLGSEMKKSATQLVADTLRFSELFVVPQISQNSSEVLTNLESRIGGLGDQLERLGGSFSSIIDVIDSKQNTLATGLDALITAVAESNRTSAERVETLVATVDQSTETTQTKADDRAESFMATVDKAMEKTNRLADERLGAIVSSVATTNRLADERLEALVGSIRLATEEAQRLADERLATLVRSVEKTTQNTHQQANERLAGLVDTVGQSIDQSRRQAEAQLDEKASNLAQKLNEAAGVLASLATTKLPTEAE